MKYIAIFLLYAIFPFSIISQIENPVRPYQKIKFQGLDPDWYEVNYDATMISDSSDGYNYFCIPTDVPDIIDGDFLYSAYLKFGKRERFTGTYITKRNLLTGELLWRVRYGYPDDDRQEVVRLMYLNKDGNIETINQVKPDPYLTNNWYQTFITFIHSKRVYDSKTGEMLFHDKPDYKDKSLYNTRMDYFTRVSTFFKEGDSIRYIHYLRRMPDNYFHFNGTLMAYNSKSESLRIDTLNFDVENNAPCVMSDFKETNPTRLNENSYLFIESTRDDKPQLYFRYADKNLNIKEEFESIVLGERTFLFQLHIVSKDQQRYLIYNPVNYKDSLLGNVPQKNILVLDRKARLLSKVELNQQYQIIEVLEWKEDNSMKIIATRTNNANSDLPYFMSLDLLNVDSEGKITLVKKFVPTDSLRFLNTIISTKLNNKYLIKAREGSIAIQNNDHHYDNIDAKAFSYFLIDEKYFDTKSSTYEAHLDLEVDIYPNPTNNILRYDFIETFDGKYEIYNTVGVKVAIGSIKNDNRGEIDVTLLDTGIYFIHFSTSNGKKVKKVIKFVKI